MKNINFFENFLPTYTQIKIKSWTIYYNEIFSPTLKNLNKSSLDILQELFFNQGISRGQIVLNGVTFLVAVFPKEKSIKLASPKLSQELLILENLKDLDQQKFNPETMQKFLKFKQFTTSIAELNPKIFASQYDRITQLEKLSQLTNSSNIYTSLNNNISRKIEILLGHMKKYKPSIFERISDYSLFLTAEYALLRVHILKFIAILPSLEHDKDGSQIKLILLETLRRLLHDNELAKKKEQLGQNKPLPRPMEIILKSFKSFCSILPAYILSYCAKKSVKFMAKRFIAGIDINDATHTLKKLAKTGRNATLDQLGELVISEKEADIYLEKIIEMIHGLKKQIHGINSAGILKAHISIKVSALCSDFRSEDFESTYLQIAPRLRKILIEAMNYLVFINIDAEHYHYRDMVFEIYKKVLLTTKELHQYNQTGIVLQAYLKDATSHYQKILNLAKERKMTMPIRLVKGAYWDVETIEAKAHGFSAYQFLNKEETDLHFRQLIIAILESSPDIQLCLASHNYTDHAFAEVIREIHFSNAPIIEHQCLHMTYEVLSYSLAQMGWAVRNYIPVGKLLVGMAYLVRRIMENSSQVGVLTIMRSHNLKEKLLPPEQLHLKNKKNNRIIRDWTQRLISSKFFNIKPLRLYIENEKEQFLTDMIYFKEVMLGNSYHNYFEELFPNSNDSKIQNIYSSSSQNILVGKIKFFEVKNLDNLINTLENNYINNHWWTNRDNYLLRSIAVMKVALLLHQKRSILASLIVYEAGKTPIEALADVDEAIDFCNYYARIEINDQNKDINNLTARGITCVIAPWNFPLAIPCGMTIASLVTGNFTILKSSELTPLIATEFSDIIYQAGVPKEVFIHLPSFGNIVGQKLIDNKKIATYVFTGSKRIGQKLYKEAGKRFYTNPLNNKTYPVKIIAEMGGKNTIIVTQSAELDETISGILTSTFSHAGQKCSACSRILVDKSIKDKLMERLIQGIKDLKVGSAFKFNTLINPLISKTSKKRLENNIHLIRQEIDTFGGKIHIDLTNDNYDGYCIGPLLVEFNKNRLINNESMYQQELFGPILYINSFDSLEEAAKLTNITNYALTAGIYSQSEDDIDYLKLKLEAGNIYINRPLTGARVGIEPFGGFKKSGTGPKAGGKDYLRSFRIMDNNIFQTMTMLDNNKKFQQNSQIESTSETNINISPYVSSSLYQRIDYLTLSLRKILNNFEVFFEISGKRKRYLSQFKKWIEQKSLSYFTSNHDNRQIPGQKSFNNMYINKKHALIISSFEEPTFNNFMQFIAALLSGSVINITCLNSKAFKWWTDLINIFYNSGFKKQNIQVSFISIENIEKLVSTPKLETIIIDGDQKFLENTSCHIANHIENSIHMKKVITSLDQIDINDFERLVLSFVFIRSFAVNTIRYGAPLELEF